MNARSPPGIARFDSAAAMVQAVAAFLHGRDVASLSGSPLLDRTMPLVNYLPRRARECRRSRARARSADFAPLPADVLGDRPGTQAQKSPRIDWNAGSARQL